MEISGIMRAVLAAGSQTALAAQISSLAGRKISQSRVSEWLDKGYVPRARSVLVSQATGIPVVDLERKSKRKGSTNGG